MKPNKAIQNTAHIPSIPKPHHKDQTFTKENHLTHSKMNDKIIIDSIGPSALTITMRGETHSVPLASDVLRISDARGGVEHGLDSLPLIYDRGEVGGRLTICDGAGKMVYCWRSAGTLRSRLSGFAHGRSDGSSSSSSSSLGPGTPIDTSTPDTNLAPASPNDSKKRDIIPGRMDDMRRMSTVSSTAMETPTGKSSHDMTDSQNNSQGYIDLEDEGTDQPGLGITRTQNAFLINTINKLLKLSYGGIFRHPGAHDNLSSQPMSLWTIRTNLHQNLYPSIEALKADFDRMEEIFVNRYGSEHRNTQDVQTLKAAFERYMTEHTGRGPRKKAKKTGSKIPPAPKSARKPARKPARGGASSPPRAAKSSMQGRKYP